MGRLLIDTPAVGGLGATQEAGAKGLKVGALGFVSSVVIGVSSTAPGYSLAASLGLVVAAVGFGSPAVMWVSFIPMLLVATSYYISPLGGGDVRDYKEALEKVATKETSRALDDLGAAGISATAQHVSGRPGEAIVAVATEVGAAMIVVGSPSRGPLTAAFLGSVVLDLVQRSPVPILVVPV